MRDTSRRRDGDDDPTLDVGTRAAAREAGAGSNRAVDPAAADDPAAVARFAGRMKTETERLTLIAAAHPGLWHPAVLAKFGITAEAVVAASLRAVAG